MTIDAPLSIGEIFDHAVAILTERWRPVLLLQSIYVVVVVVLRIAIIHSHDIRLRMIAFQLPTLVGVVTAPAIIAVLASPPGDRDVIALLGFSVRIVWRSFVATIIFWVATLVAVVVPLLLVVIFRAIGGPFVYAGWTLFAITATIAASAVIGYGSIAYANLVLEAKGPMHALRDAQRRSASTGPGRVLFIGAAIFVFAFLPEIVIGSVPDRFRFYAGVQVVEAVMFMTAFVFAYALQTVASIDYRNRARGDDLFRALRGTVWSSS